ncbi:spore coat protein CotJB [Gorillibacterium timonense]|uniref:spore coat protein CotJB n=1 Tax=Gorillibacterium timonense TaxID=1689269 RepID=UPI00071E0230|nr:spore coat protein CotJB [Gorillibacterium timonense]
MQKQLDAQYYALLEQLQAIDFVLVELTLYLDTHPLDLAAVRQFNQLSKERWALAQAYEMQYGPLLQFGLSMSREPWDWADAPWPWQV